jgi:hypothetical protein
MAMTAFIDRLKALEAEDLLSAQLGLPQTAFSASPSADHLEGSQYLSSPAAARSYLLSIYPALRRHYHWFRTSQKGQLKQWGRKPPSRLEAYRWRGRTEKHVLTSGLDDYPRATPPSNGELHVDLLCWMGFFARAMGEVAEYLGEDFATDLAEYERNQANILANLDALHWSEDDQMYCDVTVDDEGAARPPDVLRGDQRLTAADAAAPFTGISDDSVFSCHAGYISLFPLLTGLLPPSSPHLKPILDLIADPARLWSPYGIRSLSAEHPLFGQDENYWRGPIWMPFNYMILSALYKVRLGPTALLWSPGLAEKPPGRSPHPSPEIDARSPSPNDLVFLASLQTYMPAPGPHQAQATEIYRALRTSLIDNIHKVRPSVRRAVLPSLSCPSPSKTLTDSPRISPSAHARLRSCSPPSPLAVPRQKHRSTSGRALSGSSTTRIRARAPEATLLPDGPRSSRSVRFSPPACRNPKWVLSAADLCLTPLLLLPPRAVMAEKY